MCNNVDFYNWSECVILVLIWRKGNQRISPSFLLIPRNWSTLDWMLCDWSKALLGCSGSRNICLFNNALFFLFFSGMEYHKQGRLKKLGFGRERMGNGKTFTSIAQSQHPLTNRHTKLLEIFSNCMIECVFGLQCPSFLFSPWQKITKMLDCTKL